MAERVQEIIEPDVAPVAEAVATEAALVEQAAPADVEQAIIIDGELVITPNSNHGIRYSKIYINFYFYFRIKWRGKFLNKYHETKETSRVSLRCIRHGTCPFKLHLAVRDPEARPFWCPSNFTLICKVRRHTCG